MRRSLFGGLVLAVCVFPVVAGSLELPANSRTLPMSFAIGQESASQCGATCGVLVFASGMITKDTPRRLEAFAREHDIDGATVALDSDGGSVRGALALGRLIRELGLSTTVGRKAERSTTGSRGGTRAILPANCESMCAFVLLGGVKRMVPAQSRVLVHQIWLGDRRDDAVAANYSAEDLVLVQRDIGQIVRYTADMGGSAELVELSLRIPPWEPMRALAGDELRHMGLDLSAEPEPAELPTASIPAVTPVSTMRSEPVMRAAYERGWALLDEADSSVVLARRHPLTYEGEPIGTFDLMLGCGDRTGRYTVTYVERRAVAKNAARHSRVEQVRLWIGDSEIALRLLSSKASGTAQQTETVATSPISASLVRAFAATARQSLSVLTSGNDQPATMIRIGNSGFPKHYPQFEASCGERMRPRLDAHALLEPR
jgi:hypothetical protein